MLLLLVFALTVSVWRPDAAAAAAVQEGAGVAAPLPPWWEEEAVDPVPPPLLNRYAAGLNEAAAAQEAALTRMETQAVDAVLASHGLPASDRTAVLGWARSEALAELWGLMLEALKTAPAERSGDQREAVAWLTDRYHGLIDATSNELLNLYTSWAGIDQSGIYSNASSQAATTAWLEKTPLNYNTGNPATATSGYCKFRAPPPFGDEYKGYEVQLCYETCTSLFCDPPAPSFDQFRKWSTYNITQAAFGSGEFAAAAHGISKAGQFGLASVGAGIAATTIALTMGELFVGTAIQGLLFPFVGMEMFNFAEGVTAATVASHVATTSTAGAVTAAGVAAVVGIVIIAVTIAAIYGVQLFDQRALPGKIAAVYHSAGPQARQSVEDLGTHLRSDEGQSTFGASPELLTNLYSLFTKASLPTPSFEQCVNQDGYWYYYESDGSQRRTPNEKRPCLNAPAIPAAAQADPVFAIKTEQDGVTDMDYRADFQWHDTTNGSWHTARTSGNWFIDTLRSPSTDRDLLTAQSLKIHYSGWDGVGRTAWLRGGGQGEGGTSEFIVLQDSGDTAPDPAACEASGACAVVPELQMVTPEGEYVSISTIVSPPRLERVQAAGANAGMPSDYYAEATTDLGDDLYYRWRFERFGNPITLDGDLREDGVWWGEWSDWQRDTVYRHTFSRGGPFKAQAQVRDSRGKTDSRIITVEVGPGAGPQLALAPPAPKADPSCRRTDPCLLVERVLGQSTRLTGVITDSGSDRTETVRVDWGDGTPVREATIDPVVSVNLADLQLSRPTPTTVAMDAGHTYTTPGNKRITVTVTDETGRVDKDRRTVFIGKTQTIEMPPIEDKVYGDDPFTITATGGTSDAPVQVRAMEGCTLSDVRSERGDGGRQVMTATLTITRPGPCIVDTAQRGDPTHFAAVSQTVQFDARISPDDAAPVLQLPGDITREATGKNGARVFYEVTATDDIDDSITAVCSVSSGAEFNPRATTVQCQATDRANHTVTGTFTVTVTDTTGPAFTPQADLSVAATGPDGARVSYQRPRATDVVDGPGLDSTCSPASRTQFPLGETTVTCTATDRTGNTGQTSFKVVVSDSIKPELSATADLTVDAVDANGAAVTYVTPTATDNLGDAPAVTCDRASGSVFPLGETTVTCSATDAAGNVGTSTFKVTVADRAAPVLAATADRTVEATGADGAMVSFAVPAATDNVDGAPDVTCTKQSPAMFALGATTVTCTATDAAGNAADRSFVITVVDRVAPTLSRTADITVTAATAGGSTVTYALPTATDAVGVVAGPTCSPASGTTFTVGATTVTCTATDAAGNTGTSTFTVTVAAFVNRADLKVTVAGPATATQGSTVTYTVAVTNLGPAAASNPSTVLSLFGVQITGTEPAGKRGGLSIGGLRIDGSQWTQASLAPGATATYTVTGKLTGGSGSTLRALAGTRSDTPDPSSSNNIATTSIKVSRPR